MHKGKTDTNIMRSTHAIGVFMARRVGGMEREGKEEREGGRGEDQER